MSDAEAGQVIKQALEQYLAKGGKPGAIGDALGVTGRDRYAAQRYRRDDALRQAHRKLQGTPWQRSSALAQRINHFTRIVWPRYCYDNVPPDRLDEVDKLLCQAAKSGLKLPETPQGIHNICQI